MSESPELTIEELRPLVMDALNDFYTGKSDFASNLQVATLFHQVGRVCLQKEIKNDPGDLGSNWGKVLSKKEAKRIGEIITNLQAEGVIMWKLDPTTSSGAPFMDITEYGEKMLESNEITPHDPDGFIAFFIKDVPEAKKIVEVYLTECVQTYRTNNTIASSVMLGVSAEGVFDDLHDSLVKSLTDRNRIAKFEKLKKSGFKEQFDEVMKQIREFKQFLDKQLEENIESHLNGILELIRLQRNDNSHPTFKEVDKADLFVLMRLFRAQAKSSYAVKKWLDDNYAWENKLKV